MGNFNIISFTDLMRCSSPNVATAQQNSDIVQELKAPSNGVYIQDVSHKLWRTEDWDNSVKPNAIAVISDKVRFLVALTQLPSTMRISRHFCEPLEKYMTVISDKTAAKADYDGAGNTAKILKVIPSTGYAAGYCDAYVFPDGKTKGFLPSLGQLNLVFQDKAAVNDALSKCGGIAMSSYYWSSTFWGVGDIYRRCWGFSWSGGGVGYDCLCGTNYVRPFANFN